MVDKRRMFTMGQNYEGVGYIYVNIEMIGSLGWNKLGPFVRTKVF